MTVQRTGPSAHAAARAPDPPPDADGCADERLEFLTSDVTPATPVRVRPSILASWQRSRERGLRADRVEAPFVRDPDVDTPLTRSAEPVLRRLAERLADGPATNAVSIILTDPAGLVLTRRTRDPAFERHLDRVLLAPGFSYAEHFTGTNGIGTALETGRATQVFGHEHYAEDLERLACAAAPIHDPVTGRMAGVLDLTCWRKDTDTLLLTLAETTAEQIQQAMLASAGHAETAVLHAYRRACRRTGGMVLAVTADAVTLNDRARVELDSVDQSALLAQAAVAATELAPGRRRSVDVALAHGATGRMSCLQVGDGEHAAGMVLTVRVGTPLRTGHPAEGPPPAPLPAGVPGLVGDSFAWRQACSRARRALSEGGWVALTGEPGVGKLALARALVQGRPGGRVLDCRGAANDRTWSATVRRALAGADRVVVAHVDALSRVRLRRLAAAFQDAATAQRGGPSGVVITLAGGARRPETDALLESFPHVIEVPPLRLRPDDIPALVTHFLAAERTTCAPHALHLLTRAWWPGNVEQLRQLLRRASRGRHGTITADDLPDEVHSLSRRILTPIESLERDAIVGSLADAHGNKGLAARVLGISRATIYRRIHDYGIATH